MAVKPPEKFKLVVLVMTLLMGGCATPETSLWPPDPGTPTKKIYVSLDTWHAMIAFPRGRQQEKKKVAQTSTPDVQGSEQPNFEEWGYAERSWYLEGKQGFTGVMRAMIWPTEGVVEIAEYDQVWADRTPQPPSDLFTFHLSHERYQRLRHHLRSTIASPNPVAIHGGSRFYQAFRSYHLFHHCHQYVARALQEAGLPISDFSAINRTSLAGQLKEAEDLQNEGERE